MIGGAPRTLHFEAGKLTHLTGQLRSFTTCLILFFDGRLVPNEAIETAHTTLEAVLRSRVATGNRGASFAQLVDEAVRNGLLPQALGDLLLDLRKVRRRAKHRGQGVAPDRASPLIQAAIAAVHYLLRSEGKAND